MAIITIRRLCRRGFYYRKQSMTCATGESVAIAYTASYCSFKLSFMEKEEEENLKDNFGTPDPNRYIESVRMLA